jgi:hypothetical protein
MTVTTIPKKMRRIIQNLPRIFIAPPFGMARSHDGGERRSEQNGGHSSAALKHRELALQTGWLACDKGVRPSCMPVLTRFRHYDEAVTGFAPDGRNNTVLLRSNAELNVRRFGLSILQEWRLTMIRKTAKGYQVVSEKGKNLGGPYKTREEANKRLREVEFFKHHPKH